MGHVKGLCLSRTEESGSRAESLTRISWSPCGCSAHKAVLSTVLSSSCAHSEFPIDQNWLNKTQSFSCLLSGPRFSFFSPHPRKPRDLPSSLGSPYSRAETDAGRVVEELCALPRRRKEILWDLLEDFYNIADFLCRSRQGHSYCGTWARLQTQCKWQVTHFTGRLFEGRHWWDRSVPRGSGCWIGHPDSQRALRSHLCLCVKPAALRQHV